jgi:hypothetical protein
MKKMKKILLGILFAIALLAGTSCKSTSIITNDNKSNAQKLTPEEAVEKLRAIIETSVTGASTGFEDMVIGGVTTVLKDSIRYYKMIGPQIDKSVNSFTGGYETVPTYKDGRIVQITVRYSRVNTIKIHESKKGDLRISIKDGYESVLNKAMYQFDTSATNRDLIISLFSILIPKAKIEYSK